MLNNFRLYINHCRFREIADIIMLNTRPYTNCVDFIDLNNNEKYFLRAGRSSCNVFRTNDLEFMQWFFEGGTGYPRKTSQYKYDTILSWTLLLYLIYSLLHLFLLGLV